jgi:hypothetical protein
MLKRRPATLLRRALRRRASWIREVLTVKLKRWLCREREIAQSGIWRGWRGDGDDEDEDHDDDGNAPPPSVQLSVLAAAPDMHTPIDDPRAAPITSNPTST